MSQAPPPYPGEKGGPPPSNAPYPQQPGYGPPSYQPPPGQPGYQQPYPGAYPQGQYLPQGQAQPTTVVVTQPVAFVQQFREVPVHTKCPHCQAEIVTGTSYETGTFTWLLCVGLCVFGCDLGCCLIPFCVEGCKDVVHNCPNCKQVVGRWNRL